MQLPVTVEVKGIRVLTSKQIAEAYQTTTDTIKTNFNANRNRFVEEKHYIALTGDELKAFKKQVRNPYLVANRASHLYLWTEKGALLHAKSLNTDKAWEVYDYLVDFYFRAKEQEKKDIAVPDKTRMSIPHMDDAVEIFKILLATAEAHGILLRIKDLNSYRSCLKGNRIAVKKSLAFEETVYEIAWELSHYFIHYNKGDLINSPLSEDYNAQATRAAYMIIDMLNQKVRINRLSG